LQRPCSLKYFLLKALLESTQKGKIFLELYKKISFKLSLRMKTKPKPTLIMAILVCLLQSVSIQAQEASNSERWELGVDALSLIDRNSFPPYSLFGRYMLNPEGEKKSHLRARIGYDMYSYLNMVSDGAPLEHDRYAFAFSVMAGYQKEIRSMARSSIYIGSDLSFSRESSKKRWYSSDVQGHEDYSNSKIGLHALAGYSYSLGSRIKISLESSLSILLRNERLDQDINYVEQDIRLFEDSSGTRIVSRINPFHQLLITYKF
jgi:opacity protein-like surface antigen